MRLFLILETVDDDDHDHDNFSCGENSVSKQTNADFPESNILNNDNRSHEINDAASAELTDPKNDDGSVLSILDGTFFKIIERKQGKVHVHVKAQCQKCLPLNEEISGLLHSSTNFLRHLRVNKF